MDSQRVRFLALKEMVLRAEGMLELLDEHPIGLSAFAQETDTPPTEIVSFFKQAVGIEESTLSFQKKEEIAYFVKKHAVRIKLGRGLLSEYLTLAEHNARDLNISAQEYKEFTKFLVYEIVDEMFA